MIDFSFRVELSGEPGVVARAQSLLQAGIVPRRDGWRWDTLDTKAVLGVALEVQAWLSLEPCTGVGEEGPFGTYNGGRTLRFEGEDKYGAPLQFARLLAERFPALTVDCHEWDEAGVCRIYRCTAGRDKLTDVFYRFGQSDQPSYLYLDGVRQPSQETTDEQWFTAACEDFCLK